MADQIVIHDTSVLLWAEVNPADHEERLWRQYRSVLSRMSARGWKIQSDPEVDDRYPSLSRTTRVAHLDAMRMLIELRGRCIKTEVYLDGVFENPNGHRYDFTKLRHMTRVQRLRCVLAMTAVARNGFELGYVLSPKQARTLELSPSLELFVRDMAEHRLRSDPLDDFNSRWNFESDWSRGGRFERDESGWPAVREYDGYGRNVDADGVPLRNGEVRYVVDYLTRRLIRGAVYTNMNEMWMVDTGVGRRYVHRSELFSSPEPSSLRLRHVPDQANRLEKEIERALKSKDFLRVGALSMVRATMVEEAVSDG